MAGRTGTRQARRWSRGLAALSIGVAAALGAAACSPVTTQLPYAPSDGARAVLGDQLTVENLLILTAAEGDPALIVGGLTNRSTSTIEVTLSFGDAATDVQVQVPASDTVLLNPANPDGETVVVDPTPGAPGTNVQVTIATASAGSTSVAVPVLDGTLAPYDQWLDYLDGAGES